jgi:hypothetical protein
VFESADTIEHFPERKLRLSRNRRGSEGRAAVMRRAPKAVLQCGRLAWRGALRVDEERIQRLAGRHEKPVSLGSAEGDVRAALRQADQTDQASVRVPDRDAAVLDSNTGDCEVTNKKGQFKLKLKIANAIKPGEVFIQPVDGLDENVLFEPAIIDGHKAVHINTAHPYYHKEGSSKA